jgi:hypothetical protein
MSQHVITLSMGDHTSEAIPRIQLATLFEQLARTKQVQRFLYWLRLDPRQFVLFLELFRTLSAREELMGSFGVNRFNITYLSYWAALMSVYILVFLIFGCAVPPAPVYALADLFITFAMIFLVFVREAANSLFNPVEASMLAHTPIHAPTYAAAKIVHIAVSLYLAFGTSMISGLPFSGPANESRNMVKSIYIQICGIMAIAFPIVAQVNLWPTWRYVRIAVISMGVGTWFVLHANLNRLEKEILWRLYLLKMGLNQMFREFE